MPSYKTVQYFIVWLHLYVLVYCHYIKHAHSVNCKYFNFIKLVLFEKI